jgi:sarcosine oxidase, subunit gamma
MVSSNFTSGHAFQRSPALAVLPLDEAGAVSIAPLEPGTCLSLRLRASALWDLDPSHCIQLNIPINTCRLTGERTVARLGPDEWWVLCPDAGRLALEQNLQTLLNSRFASVVDISHRQATIAVAGTHARDVINTGCPLDLDDASFPAGTATRTLLGKAEIILIRTSTAQVYRLECLRSFVIYVHTFLMNAAREFMPQPAA